MKTHSVALLNISTCKNQLLLFPFLGELLLNCISDTEHFAKVSLFTWEKHIQWAMQRTVVFLRQECDFTPESSEYEASYSGKGLHTPTDA